MNRPEQIGRALWLLVITRLAPTLVCAYQKQTIKVAKADISEYNEVIEIFAKMQLNR